VAGQADLEATHADLGDGAVQREQPLRTSDGKVAKDPVTGEGRRLDHAVIDGRGGKGKAVEAVETTSKTADKTAQASKEARIRESGGTFVRDRRTKDLVDFKEVKTEIKRRE